MQNEPEIPKYLPFLKSLCWQREGIKNLTPLEILKRYERGWHYRGVLAELTFQESQFVKELAQYYGSWLESDMFDQELHQKILTILNQLNTDFFRECGVYFGDGTLVSLNNAEYRLSKDIDFICSNGKGYRLLRQEVNKKGYNGLFTSQNGLELLGEIQANQYGVKFPIIVDKIRIKFEIILEGRIELGEPDYPSWAPVTCLNEIDIFAEKLLANADRWSDTSVESRDLIDLALQRLKSPISEAAINKAEAAYPVIEPLQKAIINFQQNPDYRERCFRALRILDTSKIIDGVDLLAADFGLGKTSRTFKEIRNELDNY